MDTYSTPEAPPVTVLRDDHGKMVMTLDKADISKLARHRVEAAHAVIVKARDGKTDLYGLLYAPRTSIPTGSTRSSTTSTRARSRAAWAAAASRRPAATRSRWPNLASWCSNSTPWALPGGRNSFQTAYYGNMGDNTLPDQIAGMKQVAARYQ